MISVSISAQVHFHTSARCYFISVFQSSNDLNFKCFQCSSDKNYFKVQYRTARLG